MKRIFVLIMLSVILIFGLNYTGLYNIDLTVQNLIYMIIFLAIVSMIYRIIFKFIKSFASLFIIVIVLMVLYYFYVYFTGKPIESLDLINQYLFS